MRACTHAHIHSNALQLPWCCERVMSLCEWVTSHMNGSCLFVNESHHIWTHTWMSHVTHTYEWVTSHTHMNESRHTHTRSRRCPEAQRSHVPRGMSHVSLGMSHIALGMSHVTHAWTSYVTHTGTAADALWARVALVTMPGSIQVQCVAVCCSALQRVAMCCNVLQRVAVRCNVLQCEDESHQGDETQKTCMCICVAVYCCSAARRHRVLLQCRAVSCCSAKRRHNHEKATRHACTSVLQCLVAVQHVACCSLVAVLLQSCCSAALVTMSGFIQIWFLFFLVWFFCPVVVARVALGTMWWLRLVGSLNLKLQVSFAEYSLYYRALLQKRPMISRSLLNVATPYGLLHPVWRVLNIQNLPQDVVWRMLVCDIRIYYMILHSGVSVGMY